MTDIRCSKSPEVVLIFSVWEYKQIQAFYLQWLNGIPIVPSIRSGKFQYLGYGLQQIFFLYYNFFERLKWPIKCAVKVQKWCSILAYDNHVLRTKYWYVIPLHISPVPQPQHFAHNLSTTSVSKTNYYTSLTLLIHNSVPSHETWLDINPSTALDPTHRMPKKYRTKAEWQKARLMTRRRYYERYL